MPRAYCPECGAEVPVDEDGRCHVGHQVDLAAATGSEDLSEAARGLEAEFEERHPDEPEPWVADVDDTASGAYTPPPVGEDGPGAVARDADEQLPPEDRPGATSPGESSGWQPPTTDPVGPGPQPPPEPAAAPDIEDDDFDIDDLEAAVAELEVEERGAGPEPHDAATQPPPPIDDTEEPELPQTSEGDAAQAAPPAPSSPPPPAEDATPAVPDTPGGDDELEAEAAERDDGDPEEREPTSEIDLSNFTASGDRVEKGGKKRGLFGFGR